MIAFAAALLCLVSPGQASEDVLAKIPELSKKITIESASVVLPEITQYISKETGLEIRTLKSQFEYKACVYVKDMPAWRLLHNLCILFDQEARFEGGRLFLSHDKVLLKQRFDYLYEEDKLLERRAHRRLWALATATFGKPTPAETKFTQEELDTDDKKLAAWASDAIQNGSLYAVGVFARSHQPPGTILWRPALPLAYVDSLAPKGFYYWPQDVFPYRLAMPNTVAGARFNDCSLDEGSAPFEGTHIVLNYEPVTGIFRYGTVRGAAGQEIDPDPPLVRWPKPIGALKETEYGKKLLAWEEPPKKNPDWMSKAAQPAPVDAAKAKGMLSDRLRTLHEDLGISIVADAFRVPSKGGTSPPAGKTVAERIRSLKDEEACLTRIEDDALLVRHGGFWRLALTEPSEGALRQFEAVAKDHYPTLLEYAALTTKINAMCSRRFERDDYLVAAFDFEPLRKAYCALMKVGYMPLVERKRFFSGLPSTIIQPGGLPELKTGSLNITGTIDEINLWASTHEMFWAPFYGAKIVGRGSELLESLAIKDYLTAENRYVPYWQAGRMTRQAEYFSLVYGFDGRIGLYWHATRNDGVIYWVNLKPPPPS